MRASYDRVRRWSTVNYPLSWADSPHGELLVLHIFSPYDAKFTKAIQLPHKFRDRGPTPIYHEQRRSVACVDYTVVLCALRMHGQ
jgi:hypothetical protein